MMKGVAVAVAGAIIAFIGWWTPWLDFGLFYSKGDLLIRAKPDLSVSLPVGNDPAIHVALLLLCYVAFFGLLIYANLKDNPQALGFAGVSALLIVFLEIFFLINAAVFSLAWDLKFRYSWQWGILVMFVGLAFMLWGVFSMWLDSRVEGELTYLKSRLDKLESQLAASHKTDTP